MAVMIIVVKHHAVPFHQCKNIAAMAACAAINQFSQSLFVILQDHIMHKTFDSRCPIEFNETLMQLNHQVELQFEIHCCSCYIFSARNLGPNESGDSMEQT